MLLWSQNITIFKKASNYAPIFLSECRLSEKVEHIATADGTFLKQKILTCRIPAKTAAGAPQTGDVICAGFEKDCPQKGKEGRFIESHRAFIVQAVTDNTLSGILPHYKAVSG